MLHGTDNMRERLDLGGFDFSNARR
jgi:hypothetical protein